MTFWTILWITVLGGDVDGLTYPILYKSEADCVSASAVVSDTLKYDHSMECVVSEIPSSSPRPKARPEHK